MSGGSALAVLGGFMVVLGGLGRWRMGRLLARSNEDDSAGILETVEREHDRRDYAFIAHLDQRIMYAWSPAIVVLGVLLLVAGLWHS